jgi:hypothetical protein
LWSELMAGTPELDDRIERVEWFSQEITPECRD